MTKNIFEFHTGYTYSPTGSDQHKGDCVFCGEPKFHFGPEYLWDCKSCQRRGNKYEFLQQFHTLLVEPPVSILAAERGLATNTLTQEGVRFNQFQSSQYYHVFCIPTYNSDDKINNLLKVIPHPDKPGKRLILCSPSIKNTLYNFPSSPQKMVWLLEGHWDRLAAVEITQGRPITCISWPGGKFDPSWTKSFAGCDLCIFPDRDPINPKTGKSPGEEELQRILKVIDQVAAKPKSIRVMHWPTDLPDKFDVNDLYKLQGPNSFDYLESHLDKPKVIVTHHQVVQADATCDSFDKLLADAASTYYFTHDMELLLLAMISSVYSLKIDGEQWWMRVIGPPGSSKTTIASIVGSSERTIMRDTFTGLLSGWKDEQEQDASMIPLIQDRALIIKDADAMLQQPNIAQIMAELRAFYDKQIAVTYRNRVNYDYDNIRSSFIFCGTHSLRDMDDTSLGERFLDYELHVTDEDRRAISLRALQNSKLAATGGSTAETSLKQKARGFIDSHLLLRNDTANLGPEEDNTILSLGSLISYMRASVKRDYKGRVKYKPYPEVPSRIVKQLAKAFQCAPITFNTRSVPPQVHALVSHMAKDIINVHSLRYKICEILHFKAPLSGEKICEFLRAPDPYPVATELDNMKELDMLEISEQRTSTQLAVAQFALKPHINTQFGLIQ
jgi:hypothetical protein